MDAYLVQACNNSFIISEQENKKEFYLNLIKQNNNDGLLIYINNPLEMKIYNRDGSKATMCGNGIRCFLLYGYEKGYLGKGINYVKTDAGLIKTEIIDDSPFKCKVYIKPDNRFPIKKDVFFLDGQMMLLYTAFVGTLSHIVLYKSGLDKEKVIDRIKNRIIKNNVGNISFVKLNTSNEIEVLTYERGVGYTQSCGSANCAAFYIFNSLKLVHDHVTVYNKGGSMEIYKENDCVVIDSGASICQKIS